MPSRDTIVALSTPAGESAIAVLRLSGPLCPELAAAVLGRATPPPYRYATYGTYRDRHGHAVDDCVLTLFAEGRSFTGEAMLEIAPHGNPLIVQTVLDDLLARGCRAAEPGEFTRAAFLNGRMDLSQAEAVADLIAARSERGLEAARRQLHGAVGRKMSEFTERLLGIVAHLEAYIDFPDEDLPPEDHDGPARDLRRLIWDVRELADTRRYGELLREGIRTLIVGEPNVGKSSLMNALVGTDRAIVSEHPGTTRDYLTAGLMLGNWCIEILDTAGLHEAADAIERIGISNTIEQAETADFFLLVMDAGRPPPDLPGPLPGRMTPDNTVLVESKTDLADGEPAAAFSGEFRRARVALPRGEGLDALRRTWAEALERGLPSPGPDGVAVNARHAAALDESLEALEGAAAKLREGELPELVAADLRVAVDAFGKVVGKIDNERMLDRLFASFCIGK